MERRGLRITDSFIFFSCDNSSFGFICSGFFGDN